MNTLRFEINSILQKKDEFALNNTIANRWREQKQLLAHRVTISLIIQNIIPSILFLKTYHR